MRLKRSAILAMLVLLVAATVPVASAGAMSPKGSVTPAWSDTFVDDFYETLVHGPGGTLTGDDNQANARDITNLIGVAGADYTEQHTFDAAYTSIPVADHDWFKFDVGAQEIAAGNSLYLFEALATDDPTVDPVIEIYDPAGMFVPGDPVTFPVGATDIVAADGAISAQFYEHLGTSLAFNPTLAGTHYIRVRPYADNTGGNYGSTAGPYLFRAKVGSFVRVAGADRYATAAAISREKFAESQLNPLGMWANLSTVIVTSGQNFPDALSGSFLAGAVNGPILLTRPTSLPVATAQEIARLEPDRVLVLGGEGAVSNDVMDAIKAAYPAMSFVIRVEGADRIATSVEVAMTGANLLSNEAGITMPGFCIIANARNFPDALSASSFAAARHIPIFLTDAETLDPRVVNAMSALSISDAILVGGESVLSAGIESQLQSQLGLFRVLRLAGSDRYETSMKFAAWSAGVPTGANTVGTPGNPGAIPRAARKNIGVATGSNYPDALAAAPLLADGYSYLPWGLTDARPAPLLLTLPTSTSPWLYNQGQLPAGSTSYLEKVWIAVGGDPSIDKSYIFGGSGAVSDTTWWELDVQSPG